MSPHRLAGPITDDVDALSGRTSEVQTALNDLQDKTGTQLWVWFIDTLDGAQSSSFATETARQSALGSTDLLLVIALGDREYGYWKGDNVKITDGDLEQILSQDLESGLRAQDYPGAIVGTAQALTNAMTGGPGATVTPEKTPPPDEGVVVPPANVPPGDSGGGSGMGTALAIVLAAVLIGGGLWWILTSRQRRGAPGSPAGAGPPTRTPTSSRSSPRTSRSSPTGSSSRPTTRSATPTRSSASPRPSSATMRPRRSWPRSRPPGTT